MPWIALGAAAVGGLASGIGSQSHNSQSSQVPSWSSDLSVPIGSGIIQGQRLFGIGQQVPGGGIYSDPYSMYAGPNGLQTNAANLQGQYGSNFAFPNMAMGNAYDTLSGKYFSSLDPNSNPYLQNTYRQAADQIQGTVNGQFNKAGRYGSGLQQDVLERNLGDVASNIYGENYMRNYQGERNRQMQALGMSSQIAGLPFINTQAMMNAGAQQQQWEQDRINAPLNRLNTMTQFFRNQSPGAMQTANSPYYTNPLNSALGFGLGTYAMMNRNGNQSQNQNYGGQNLSGAWGGVTPDMYSGYYG